MKAKLLLSLGLAALPLALALGLLALNGPPAARAAGETFIVNSNADVSDASPGNCVCQTSTGVCTLRAAIQEANACAGPQTIKFGGPWLITLTTALPALTDNGTVINGSDWWGVGSGLGLPMVWLDGEGRAFNGLVITASNCAVYGLVVKSFGGHGVYLHSGAQNNRIGGTGTHQRVVISGNGQNGVRIEGANTINNTVEGCYIGTEPEGTANPPGPADWSNGWHGVSIWEGGSNFIRDNLIAGNGWSGIAVDYAAKDLFQNNHIGMDVRGQPLGNGFYGIHIAHSAMPVIVSNTIAFNGRGIHVEGNSSPWIYSNLIYGHNASRGSLNRSGSGGGILCDNSSPIISSNVITNNVAYTGTDKSGYGGGIALWYCDGSRISGSRIVSNTANTAGEGYGGGLFAEGGGITITANTIMSNTAGAPTTDSRGGGLDLQYGYGSNALIAGNVIRGNLAAADGKGYGGGLRLFYSKAIVDSNVIIGNRATYGGGIDTTNSAFFTATNNFLAQNSGGGVYCWALPGPSYGLLVHNTIAQDGLAGVWLMQNSSLTLTNNIIVSHTTGIYARSGFTNSVLADYTLFYGNTNDTEGSIITSTHAITGRDPLFLDPATGNYHLRAGSPAVDAGITVPWLAEDIDGDPRPIGAGYDIGADEARFVYLPLVLRND